jgi:hypothetical protein
MLEAARNREKVFVVTDITRLKKSPPRQRHLTAEWMRRTEPLAQIASVGGATVAPSAILRGIITALYWLQRPAQPSVCVASRHEALLVGMDMLEAGGATLPNRLIAYRDACRERSAAG